jgi:hypothetical protein
MKIFSDYINEKIEEFDFGFTTLVEAKDVDFDSYPGEKEQYVDSGDLKVEWEMDFDNRKFGINSMAPIIKSISGTYTVVTPADEGPDTEEEKEFSATKDSDWEFVCELQSEVKFGHGIMPESITIDLKANKINIIF